MKKYCLKISIMGFPIKELYRIIEIAENCTFEQLHNKIFEAFDRYDEHMYSFFLTGKDTKNMKKIMSSEEITHPYNLDSNFSEKTLHSVTTTKIKDANLSEGDVIHYWFDFGDDWWHRIYVEKIIETKDRKRTIRLIKKIGDSPEQYPDYDEDNFYNDE